jgi:hypothetical protein
MHLEKHSRAHCETYEILFLTTLKLVTFQSYTWSHVMNFDNKLQESSIWNLFETCHK